MIRKLLLLLLCSFSVIANASSAATRDVATAVQVTGYAELSINSNKFVMRSGVRVKEGADITTAAGGVVQLTFDDGTNIVVGQNSKLKITEILMTSKSVASRFAVNAVTGGFRFITGNSPKESYEITTPKATMGVRGTEFDLAVTRGKTTLALFDGSVRMCRGGQLCATVQGSCAIAETGGFSGIRGVTGKKAAAALTENFSFVAEQKQLRKEFRTSTRGCGRYFDVRLDSKPAQAVPAQPVPVAPPQPAPIKPTPEQPKPAPAPEKPAPAPPSEGNFPGGSGTDGPSEGKGGGASLGQDGSGNGSGQGADNRNGGAGNPNSGADNEKQSNGNGAGNGNGNAGGNGKSNKSN